MRILNLRSNRKIKGSITVFMTFIFIIIFGLVLVLFENTRIISSKGYVKNISASAEKTLFGDYNRELFEEYGLLAYGGYNGISSLEMGEELKEILISDLAIKPENSKVTYTDIYKIKNISVENKNFEGLADGNNLCRQIKEYIVSETIEDSMDKFKNKYSKNSIFEKKDLCEKLDGGDSYETGKYKEKYKVEGEKNDKNNSVDDTKVKSRSEDNNNEHKSINTEKDADKNADIGNPLEVFKELIEDGYLSLVCDSKSISDGKIEQAVVEDDQTENDVDSDIWKSTERNKEPHSGEAEKTSDGYESAGNYLKKIFLSSGTDEVYAEDIGETNDGKARIESIIYLNKVFSSYVDNKAGNVDYGMEYIIYGNEKEKDNLVSIINRIIAARMITNFVAISGDKTICAKALATATAIAGVTGIEPVIKGVQYVILAILAFEESCIDTAALLDGRQIPIVKKISDLKIGYEEMCMVSAKTFRDRAKQYGKSDSRPVSAYVDYKEYLCCFATFVPLKKIRTRMFDIIQLELRKKYNESFRIYDCIAAADFEISYKMRFMFPYLWDLYGKNLKYRKFERSVDVSYRYD